MKSVCKFHAKYLNSGLARIVVPMLLLALVISGCSSSEF